MDNQILSERLDVLHAQLVKAHVAISQAARHMRYETTPQRTEVDAADRAVDNALAALAELREVPIQASETSTTRHGRTEVVQTHESFGYLQINRTSGHQRLFGSQLARHPHFITLRIGRAEAHFRDHSDTMDIFPAQTAGSYRDSEIVEVRMSAAQFAEAITSMGIGNGVPVTLSHVRGRVMEPVPSTHENRADRVLESFKERLKAAPAENHEAFKAFREALAASGLSKAKQAELIKHASGMHATHDENVQYTLEVFEEAAEKAKSAAVAEVDATISMMTHKLGLERLREHLALGAGED